MQPLASAVAGDRKTLLAHYMAWYESPGRMAPAANAPTMGRWGTHWTGPDGGHDPAKTDPKGLPDIASRCHPLIGPYDSTDAAVLECQLLEMKLAGIDGVVVDWYGIADAADYPAIHAGCRAMYDACGRMGMTFAACYEDRTIGWMLDQKVLAADAVDGHLIDTFRWLEREWFPGKQYLRIGGRPLLLVFGPMTATDPTPWRRAIDAIVAERDRPLVAGLHHLWRTAGFDGGFTWVHFDAWQGEASGTTVGRRLAEIYGGVADRPASVIVSALPAYDDIYPQSYGHVPYRDGATLRESLRACMAGPWPIVQLVTWNDYGEGTVLEPTHERGYEPLEIILAARRREAGRRDAASLATDDDLRLPQRLLAFRRSGGSSAEADAIAAIVAAGRLAEARQRLDASR